MEKGCFFTYKHDLKLNTVCLKISGLKVILGKWAIVGVSLFSNCISDHLVNSTSCVKIVYINVFKR